MPESPAPSPAVTPPAGNPRFPLIDGVRAIAALSIVVFHAKVGLPVAAYLYQFAAGVPIFFVVSGFLLYRPFVHARVTSSRPIRVRDYARRRLLRIVPAYWVALTLLALAPGLDGGVFSARAPIYYGFAQTFFSDTAYHGLTVAWSLSTEMTFYVVLPTYALALGRLCRGRDCNFILRAEFVVLGLLSIGSFGFRQALFGTHWNLAHTLPGTMDYFAAGMALAVVSAVAGHLGRVPRLGRWVDSHPGLCWAAAVGGFGASGLYTAATGRADPYAGGPLHYLWLITALFIFLPAVFSQRKKGLPYRVLSLRPVAWLGLVSYGIFLWHLPILGEVRQHVAIPLGARTGSLVSFSIVLIVGGAITICLAAASYYFVERPFLVRKERRRLQAPASVGVEPEPAP
jgi:peptidoglycan/LPS O-acetylase OafA/YrhL